jgi:hypothetical protein
MIESALTNSDAVPAQATRRTGVFRWMPSGGSLALLVPVVLLYWQLGGPSSLLTDPNTGVHVRTGEWILAEHDVPRKDLFSFAIAGHRWCDWEWLCDALYAVLHRWSDLAAIAAFSLAVLCLTSLLVYVTARVHTGRTVAFAMTCLVMATTTIHWLARPHLLTWLLVALFCWVIERARMSGHGAPLLALPLLMVLWVNLHPGFLAGVLVLAVWGAAEHVEGLLGLAQLGHIVDAQWCRWFSLTALACLAATLVNPYGIELHKHIVEYLFSPGTVTAQVAEWLSPDFHNPRLHWFELLLPLGAAAGLWHGFRGRLAWCALTLGGMHLALASVRNVPIFAIVCAAPLSNLIEHLVQRSDVGERFHAAGRSLASSALTSLTCYCVVGALVIAVASRPALDLGTPSSLPVEVIAHLPPGHLFTTDRWADYVIYAEPRRQVFFDCRNDLYGPGFVKEYMTVIRAEPGWQGIAAKYAFAVALVPDKSPISAALAASSDWRLSYRDATAAVFVRQQL